MMRTKQYVEVEADFSTDGKITPRSILFQAENQPPERFVIDKILSVQPGASRKVGGHGMVYHVRINGASTLLFFEPMGEYEGRWFVEAKQ